MVSCGDPHEAQSELLEVVPLRASKRMLAKERDDALDELVPPPDDELVQILLVVVVPSVHIDPTGSEEVSELAETIRASCALRHDEAMKDLIAGCVALPVAPVGLSDESDGEAPFSVYKANHPASSDQSFLLVVRTVQIVTAHRESLWRVPDGYTGFSSI